MAASPETLRWAFVTACVARRWEQAHVLLLRCLQEKQAPRNQHELIVGRFRTGQALVLIFADDDTDQDPAAWDPWPEENEDRRRRDWLRTLLTVTGLFSASSAWTQDVRDALGDAARALERAGAPQLRLSEQVVQAIGALLEGQKERAAEQLDALARCWPKLPEVLADLEPTVWLKAATAWAEAGEVSRAEALLDTCSHRFPTAKGIWRKHAEILASQTKYEEAYKCLQREAAVDADFKDDLRMRVAEALGPIAFEKVDLQAKSREYLARNVGFRASLERLVRVHWPGFSMLDDNERETWVVAAFNLWAPGAEEGTARAHAAAAARGCSVVLESVLKRRIFMPFRKEWSQKHTAGSGASPDEEVAFARFLDGQDKLALGSIVVLLQPNSTSEGKPRGALARWVGKHLRTEGVATLRRELESANKTRQRLMHTPLVLDPEDAERHYDLCRRLVEATAYT